MSSHLHRPPSEPAPRLRRLLAGVILGALITASMIGSVSLATTLAAAPAQAAPGNPGTPGDPKVLYEENFEHTDAPLSELVSLTDYVSEQGITYTADAPWLEAWGCNGFLATSQVVFPEGYCHDLENEYRDVRNKAYALGLLNSPQNPETNRAVSTNTTHAPGANLREFASSQIDLPSANGRFVTFSVDAAANNCTWAHPLLRFYLTTDDGSEIPTSTSPIDPCSDARAASFTPTSNDGREVRYGSFAADDSILFKSDSLGVTMRNEEGDYYGNDGAFDNIRVLDVTPQLDKSFSPASVPVNGVSTLTLTVTNTSDLAAKSGWSFTDNLPDGLVVADSPNLGGSCVATTSADAGATSIAVTGGRLAAGEASCTVTVDVTSALPRPADPSPKVFENCASNFNNVVGLDLPACATVEFTSAPRLEVQKTSDASANTRVGDTVRYTVRATNTGTADYSADHPARVADDLTGILDDADYNTDATVTINGAPTAPPNYTAPTLSWAGPLAVGQTATLTYTVTVKAGGDRTARNIAFNGDPNTPTPACDPPVNGIDPATGLACDDTRFLLPALQVEKSADTSNVGQVGDIVTYTVTGTNTGPGTYTDDAPATLVDDLSAVLDDADFIDGSLTASTGTTPVFDNGTITWNGALAVNQTVTITYQVRYTAAGDTLLQNVAWSPEDPEHPNPPVCSPRDEHGHDPVTGEPCATVEVPAGKLQVSKSVNPEDGSTVIAGQELTYTLTFENTGQGTATVTDWTDTLAGVLDDADLINGPASSSDALTATLDSDTGTIAISGSIPAASTATITYTVQVRADDARSNDTLNNFLFQGEPPTDPTCVSGDPLCTENFIPRITDSKSVDPATGTTVQPGQQLTYTLTFTNDGTGAGSVDRVDDLTHVLDDANVTTQPRSSDPGLTVSEIANQRFAITGTVQPGATVTVTYTVTVKPAGQLGDKHLANFLLDPGTTPPAEPVCEPGTEDCTANPISEITVVKTANPETGTQVTPGQEVSYTLTFQNTGAATGPVDYTDHMSGVLDDADLTQAPTSHDPALTASPVTDGSFTVTGALAPGAQATVTYTVTIRDWAQQGDHTLGNFVTTTGEQPPTACATANPLCTEHPVREPKTPHLPVTGGPGTTLAALLAGILLLGGGTALALRRTRTRTRTRTEATTR